MCLMNTILTDQIFVGMLLKIFKILLCLIIGCIILELALKFHPWFFRILFLCFDVLPSLIMLVLRRKTYNLNKSLQTKRRRQQTLLFQRSPKRRPVSGILFFFQHRHKAFIIVFHFLPAFICISNLTDRVWSKQPICRRRAKSRFLRHRNKGTNLRPWPTVEPLPLRPQCTAAQPAAGNPAIEILFTVL